MDTNTWHVVSDLHADMAWGPTQVLSSAKYLALCGDVAEARNARIYRRALEVFSPHYEKVFLVPGNHEYYGGTLLDTRAALAKIVEPLWNVVLLNNDTHVLDDDTTVIGSTLWSEIPPENERAVQMQLRDYQAIRGGPHNRSITPADTTRLFHQNVQWIKRQVDTAPGPCVVLTHHAPLLHGVCAPEHHTSNVKTAFGTDLSHLFCPKIALWAFGHSHWTVNQAVNGTRLVSRPRGYAGEDVGGFYWKQDPINL
jgi:predicted phosphohydrolase